MKIVIKDRVFNGELGDMISEDDCIREMFEEIFNIEVSEF